MKNAILVTLLASTLGFGATAAHADDNATEQRGYGHSKHEGGKHAGKRGGGRHGGGMMKRMVKKLDLTDAQQAQIKTLREAQKDQHKALREEQKALRTEMQALDTTSADYQSKVVALADKKANLDRKSFIQRSESKQQFEAVLTVEQRAKLKEMKESRKSRGGKRGGKRHGKQSAE